MIFQGHLSMTSQNEKKKKTFINLSNVEILLSILLFHTLLEYLFKLV